MTSETKTCPEGPASVTKVTFLILVQRKLESDRHVVKGIRERGAII